MIRLDLSDDPRWLDLGRGVRVQVRPLTSPVYNLIQARALELKGQLEDDARQRRSLRRWPAGAGPGVPPRLSRAVHAAGRRKKRLYSRARWHWGGGRAYCRRCHDDGLPCARGRRNEGGQRCPSVEHAPLTVEGWQAWDLLERAAGQLRTNGNAITGLDLTACLTLGVALGYDSRAMAELLPHGEAGLVEGLASQHLDERDEVEARER